MSENYVCESLKFLNIKQCETKGKKQGMLQINIAMNHNSNIFKTTTIIFSNI